MNIQDKVKQIKSGKLTAEKNVNYFLDKIKTEDKKYNSVLVINENALEEAKEIDKKKIKGKLAGICFLIKSNICVKNLETNCASKTLEGWKATYDAKVIEKIKKEDGVILGMTNMDEFASGGSGETSAFGPAKNPVILNLIPGGSSSGSAVAVAAGFCDCALGSDTGGSVRNPASHCGVVGVKPSYGLVSRYGLIDLAMSFDQIGPLTKDVDSSKYILDIIKGRDENDPTTFDSKEIKDLKLDKIKIGALKVHGDYRIQEIIDKKIKEIIDKHKWSTKNVEIKYLDLAIQTYYPIVYVEFFSGTRKFDGRRYGKIIEDSCGPEVLRRIIGGSEISKAEYEGRYYKRALEVKNLIKKEFENVFKKFDCVISPTVPILPHKLGSEISTEEMYSYDALTVPANLAGICAMSIPVGKVDGIPVGLQIMCNSLEESKMFSIAKVFE